MKRIAPLEFEVLRRNVERKREIGELYEDLEYAAADLWLEGKPMIADWDRENLPFPEFEPDTERRYCGGCGIKKSLKAFKRLKQQERSSDTLRCAECESRNPTPAKSQSAA